MSFDKHSNFNPKANFSEVKFGENMPVLEVELNEMQQIQNEARADIIRDTMPSGFVNLGEIDYDSCVNNDNQIKLKTESIAYVNGYRITIPKDTIIEIGESDKVREDLVFLEVWKEAVNDMNTLTEYGGENNSVINNQIKDSRYPVATSQRVALKYRIRHVADIDFNTYVFDGFTKDSPSVSGFTHNNQQVLAIGGLSDETSLGESHRRFFNYKQRSHYKSIDNGNNVPFDGSTDVGLYVAGNERDRTQFNTIDGYVYAIPMFRLLRKPNVGLASPFEYKKIHNQLDPKKFAHLVGQENVEKVHSVNVQGKTFKNLIGNGYITSSNNNGDVKEFIEPLNPQGTYTLFAWGNLISGSSKINFNFMGYDGNIHALNQIITPEAHEGRFMKRVVKLGHLAGYTVKWRDRTRSENGLLDVHYVVLEGDHSNADLLEPFNYLKSLGESENNSITIENNLLEEGTYVHEIQNHILPTHPEVTHVSWGENVVIPPEVEIELKNGEEVIQTITQLPVKLETTGEEKLHVKTMKGRTLLNLWGSNQLYEITPNNSIYYKSSSFKSSTKYLVKFKVEQNNTQNKIVLQYYNESEWVENYEMSIKLGENKFIVTSSSNVFNVIRFFHNSIFGNETLKISNIMLIEYQEGMENWGLKYFEGIKSVEAPSIKATGKNLFTPKFMNPNNYVNRGTYYSVPINNLEEGKEYSMSFGDINCSITGLYFTLSSNPQPTMSSSKYHHFIKDGVITQGTYVASATNYVCFYSTSRNIYKDLVTFLECVSWIKLEEGEITSYECPRISYFKTPKETVLRSLPHGIFDSVDFTTGLRQVNVGEDTYTGVEDWIIGDGGVTGGMKYIGLNRDTFKQNMDTFTISTYSNVIPSIAFTDVWNERKEGLATSNSENYGVRISTSKFASVQEFKTWLKSNNLTVQYELNTPFTKKIEISEDDYVGKSKVTYQLAEPLNFIPNGVKDEIKGDKLIKRTNRIYLNGTEEWISFRDETATTYRTSFPIEDAKPSSVCMSSHYEYGTGSTVEKVKIYFTVNANCSITVLKSDFPTLDSFKTWLATNRPMVIYELANPIEIPLREVLHSECDFTLNRQFKLGYENYLKELPSGVKDVIEKGKVKRNVKHLLIKGTETWTTLSTSGDTVRAFMMLSNAKPVTETFNNFGFAHGTAQTNMNILGVDQNGNLVIGILKTLLTSPDVQGVKDYLKKKNLHVIYELKTSTTEELTEENSRYVPCIPLNSYVGSLYVTNGINQTKFLTAFSPSEYEVQTYHRHFSNDIHMFEDITSKKSPYGHKTYLEEENGKYVEKFIAGVEKHEIEDLRHKVSLTGFDYSQLLQDSFLKLIKGELS